MSIKTVTSTKRVAFQGLIKIYKLILYVRMIAAEEPGSVTVFVSSSRQVACVADADYFFLLFFLNRARARVYEFSPGACYGE